MSTNNDKSPANAREVAAGSLNTILGRQSTLDDALFEHPGYSGLSQRDKAFTRLLVTTVLRRKGQIDKVLSSFLAKMPPGYVMNALRVGTAQILYLGTPPHAAVGETVAQVKASKKFTKMAGLVNAVLRKVVAEGRKKLALTGPQDNLPDWVRKSWVKDYGRSQTGRIARQLMEIPPLDITVKSGVNEWARTLGGQAIGLNTVRVQDAGHIPDLPGFDTGEWWIQDFAASIPVHMLGDIKNLKIADICAAPGGKTLQLAAGGADVTAIDKSEKRLSRVSENLKRTQLKANIICADAVDWMEKSDEFFDIILIDAPCSATGTFRRNPDVLYNKKPRQINALNKIQKNLLHTATSRLKPNGTILYCTCSLQSTEGEMIIDDFLEQNNDFKAVPLPQNIVNIDQSFATMSDYLRILPHVMSEIGGMDGFFAATLKKQQNM